MIVRLLAILVLAAKLSAQDTPCVAIRGPYEDLAIQTLKFLEKIVEGQPPEVRRQLWEFYIEDLKGWRSFWKPMFPGATVEPPPQEPPPPPRLIPPRR